MSLTPLWGGHRIEAVEKSRCCGVCGYVDCCCIDDGRGGSKWEAVVDCFSFGRGTRISTCGVHIFFLRTANAGMGGRIIPDAPSFIGERAECAGGFTRGGTMQRVLIEVGSRKAGCGNLDSKHEC